MPRSAPTLNALLLAAILSAPEAGAQEVDFRRDIRPILSEHCFRCHGPDAANRKARLRLDTREGLFGELSGGLRVVAPGDPEESELLVRVSSEDDFDIMPPPGTGSGLEPKQVALIRSWIAAGAPWQAHWAFVPPVSSPLPGVSGAGWPRGAIDAFVLARLEAVGMEPAREADRRTLARRLSLDLTGLPPLPQEVEVFVADAAVDAYERLVDRLLASPRHGEHMARYWLDAARYGDTHGLHLDNYREMWPYRDWVIAAFNANKPFDRFVVEQLAGDLLPGAGLDELVASGFNRCHVTTNEGGAIEEEVLVRNVLDRVNTVGTVFMGLTVGCAACHDHKFDPLTQREYYQLSAFFNNLDGKPMDGNAKAHAPVVKVPGEEQARRLAAQREALAARRLTLEEELAAIDYAETKERAAPSILERAADHVWIDDELPTGAAPAGDGKPWRWIARPEHPVHLGRRSLRRGGSRGLNQDFFTGAFPVVLHAGDRLFAHAWLDPKDPPRAIQLQFNDGSWDHRVRWGASAHGAGRPGGADHRAGDLPAVGSWVRLEVGLAQVGLRPGARLNGLAFTQVGGTVYWDAAGVHSRYPLDLRHLRSQRAWEALAAKHSGTPAELRAPLAVEPAARTPEQARRLRLHYLRNIHATTRRRFEERASELERLQAELRAAENALPTTLVMKERAEARQAFILQRGQYDQRGEPVERRTPDVLPPMADGFPRDRLGFARWLVAPGHPLTARVAVNRLWQQLFGVGLVRTGEDFGSQGEPPSHPALLDWLATRFIADGWDVKRTLKRMVMSATYRQSSRVTPALHTRDPENRLLARGPRFRLDAEVLRDQALAVSGLLVEQIGGPSVRPPQPDGLWYAVGYSSSNTARFKPDKGHAKVHRRSLYTFLKRTAPPPLMSTLDAPNRETCSVRRERTNTPLQALLLMNDPQFIEAARHLAQQVLLEDGEDARASLAYHRVLARNPSAADLAELVALHEDCHSDFSARPEAARALIAIGEEAPPGDLDPVELASWTMVASLILNLDAVVTKE